MANKFAGHKQWPRASVNVHMWVVWSNELNENEWLPVGGKKGRRLGFWVLLG